MSGFLLATVIFWIVTKQLQKDWQAEYRRLMGGIKSMYEGIEMHEGKTSCNSDTYQWSALCAAYRLRQLFNGDK